MTMGDTLREFFRDAGQALEELQIHYQLMALEADSLPFVGDLPSAELLPRLRRPSESPFTDSVDAQLIAHAQQTKLPLGVASVLGMRQMFPLIPRATLVTRVSELVRAGRIVPKRSKGTGAGA